MINKFVADILNKVVGNFIYGLDDETFSITNLLSGKLELTNIHLKQTIIDLLGIPCRLNFGCIGRFKINLPFFYFMKSSINVYIEDIIIVVSTIPSKYFDDKLFKEKYIQNKKNTLLSSEYRDIICTIEGGVIWQMILSLINNINVTIKNVHFRVEDFTSNPGNCFAFGISVEEIFLSLPKEGLHFKREGYYTENGNLINNTMINMITIKKLGIYMDYLNMKKVMNAHYHLELSDLLTNDIVTSNVKTEKKKKKISKTGASKKERLHHSTNKNMHNTKNIKNNKENLNDFQNIIRKIKNDFFNNKNRGYARNHINMGTFYKTEDGFNEEVGSFSGVRGGSSGVRNGSSGVRGGSSGVRSGSSGVRNGSSGVRGDSSCGSSSSYRRCSSSYRRCSSSYRRCNYDCFDQNIKKKRSRHMSIDQDSFHNYDNRTNNKDRGCSVGINTFYKCNVDPKIEETKVKLETNLCINNDMSWVACVTKFSDPFDNSILKEKKEEVIIKRKSRTILKNINKSKSRRRTNINDTHTGDNEYSDSDNQYDNDESGEQKKENNNKGFSKRNINKYINEYINKRVNGYSDEYDDGNSSRNSIRNNRYSHFEKNGSSSNLRRSVSYSSAKTFTDTVDKCISGEYYNTRKICNSRNSDKKKSNILYKNSNIRTYSNIIKKRKYTHDSKYQTSSDGYYTPVEKTSNTNYDERIYSSRYDLNRYVKKKKKKKDCFEPSKKKKVDIYYDVLDDSVSTSKNITSKVHLRNQYNTNQINHKHNNKIKKIEDNNGEPIVDNTLQCIHHDKKEHTCELCQDVEKQQKELILKKKKIYKYLKKNIIKEMIRKEKRKKIHSVYLLFEKMYKIDKTKLDTFALFLQLIKNIKHEYILNPNDFEGYGEIYLSLIPTDHGNLPFSRCFSSWGNKKRNQKEFEECLPRLSTFITLKNITMIFADKQLINFIKWINSNITNYYIWKDQILSEFEKSKATYEEECKYINTWVVKLLDTFGSKEEKLEGEQFCEEFENNHSANIIILLRSKAFCKLQELRKEMDFNKNGCETSVNTNLNSSLNNSGNNMINNKSINLNQVNIPTNQNKTELKHVANESINVLKKLMKNQKAYDKIKNSLRNKTFTIDICTDICILNSTCLLTIETCENVNKKEVHFVKTYALLMQCIHYHNQISNTHELKASTDIELYPLTLLLVIKNLDDKYVPPKINVLYILTEATKKNTYRTCHKSFIHKVNKLELIKKYNFLNNAHPNYNSVNKNNDNTLTMQEQKKVVKFQKIKKTFKGLVDNNLLNFFTKKDINNMLNDTGLNNSIL
ncbi:N-terminal region of Chorein, a TM vesicle-mediated sorter, putative, partial [Hepatocystis sp. ex Piliocolobus tephrosceles]